MSSEGSTHLRRTYGCSASRIRRPTRKAPPICCACWTEAARKDANDPRPSVAARYKDNDGYVEAVRKEAARAVAERLLLPDDAERSVEAARQGTLARLGE